MPILSLRPYDPEYDLYLDLRYRVLRHPLGLIPGSERLESDELVSTRHYLFVRDGRALACVQFQTTDVAYEGRVRMMAVEPTARGKGYGRLTLEHLENQAVHDGYHKLVLSARELAVSFYLALGYTQEIEIEPYYGVRHWHMQKTLDHHG